MTAETATHPTPTVRPPRVPWWRQWLRERACPGHCWHPEGFHEARCCRCPAWADAHMEGAGRGVLTYP